MPKATCYFVLNGLVNGQDGTPAAKAGDGDEVQKDGWYYLFDGEADGNGPHESVQKAKDAARPEALSRSIEDNRKPITDAIHVLLVRLRAEGFTNAAEVENEMINQIDMAIHYEAENVIS